MVRKKKKRHGRPAFLALEQHRCSRAEQQQSSHRAQFRRRAHCGEAVAETGVRNLVVILEVRNQAATWHGGRAPAARLALPGKILALIQKTMPRERDKLLRA